MFRTHFFGFHASTNDTGLRYINQPEWSRKTSGLAGVIEKGLVQPRHFNPQITTYDTDQPPLNPTDIN